MDSGQVQCSRQPGQHGGDMARILHEYEDGNFIAMDDLVESLTAVDAVAASEVVEKRVAAQKVTAGAENNAVKMAAKITTRGVEKAAKK